MNQKWGRIHWLITCSPLSEVRSSERGSRKTIQIKDKGLLPGVGWSLASTNCLLTTLRACGNNFTHHGYTLDYLVTLERGRGGGYPTNALASFLLPFLLMQLPQKLLLMSRPIISKASVRMLSHQICIADSKHIHIMDNLLYHAGLDPGFSNRGELCRILSQG